MRPSQVFLTFSLLLFVSFFVVACQPVQPASTGAEPVASPTAITEVPAASGDATKTNPKDGAAYIFVPAGPFLMGAGSRESSASADVKPQTTVSTDGFWIMRTETTNAQYQRCVQEKSCTEPNNARWNDPAYAEHPVTNVTWQQANDYALWADGRLPTEAEWEKACRGEDGRVYPWGDQAPAADRANYGGKIGDTTVVGSYPNGATVYGVMDMAGNVWEWTSSKYLPYPYVAGDGREAADGSDDRTLRGGSASIGSMKLRCDLRFKFDPASENELFGFRVVLPAD